jgi:hypothetical protein
MNLEMYLAKNRWQLIFDSVTDSLFAKYNLSYNQVRGQGYDGVSNM